QETWERMGIDVKEAVKAVKQSEDRPIFQAMLFSRIVPNCKKLGLLDAGDGWLRARFTELGVIQFEDWADTSEDYADVDLAVELPSKRPCERGGEPPHTRYPEPSMSAAGPTSPVRIVFLGGVGEIGRNCFCLEVADRILVVDCGLMFPEADMPGVDL